MKPKPFFTRNWALAIGIALLIGGVCRYFKSPDKFSWRVMIVAGATMLLVSSRWAKEKIKLIEAKRLIRLVAFYPFLILATIFGFWTAIYHYPGEDFSFAALTGLTALMIIYWLSLEHKGTT